MLLIPRACGCYSGSLSGRTNQLSFLRNGASQLTGVKDALCSATQRLAALQTAEESQVTAGEVFVAFGPSPPWRERGQEAQGVEPLSEDGRDWLCLHPGRWAEEEEGGTT